MGKKQSEQGEFASGDNKDDQSLGKKDWFTLNVARVFC